MLRIGLSSDYTITEAGNNRKTHPQILTKAAGVIGNDPIDSLYLQLYIHSMKSELRFAEHSEIAGARTVEVWYGGQMIGCVYGADGPGVRVISKFGLELEQIPGLQGVQIRIGK